VEYQLLIEPYPDQYRVFRGRIPEVGLAGPPDRPRHNSKTAGDDPAVLQFV